MAEKTFDGLAKTYQDFQVPAVKVVLKGKNLAEDLGARLQSVEVSLELREESRAKVILWDCYDEESHGITAKLKGALTPGSRMEVFFGYQSSFGQVFSGYLDTVCLCLDEKDGHTLCLEAFDVIHLMKENRHSRIFQKDTHSAMFEEVMGSYGWVCGCKADKTEAIPEGEVRMQSGDDYSFVTENLAGPENPGMEFYVKAGTAYFIKKESAASDMISLKPNQGVREITAVWSFLNQKIQVQGCDGAHTAFMATETVKANTLDSSAGTGTDFQCVPYLDTQNKVDRWVSEEGSLRKAGAKQAVLLMVGLPELVAGEFMSMVEFDSLANGSYRIVRAVHTFDESGYSTELELGGT